MKILAVIKGPAGIRQILDHLGLPGVPPASGRPLMPPMAWWVTTLATGVRTNVMSAP